MKKILLIGELNDVTRSINQCLIGEFQVQLCSEQVENLPGMLRIIEPNLVIVSQIGEEGVDRAILECLQNKFPKIPVLIVGTIEDWHYCKRYCTSEQFDKLFRPISKYDLLNKCYEMLKIDREIYIPKTPNEKKKILIVDDNPLVLRNIKALLEEQYEIFLSTSGDQALKMIASKEPDLLLLDYEMPGMNGKEVFEAMKENEFAKDIPVIFLTGIAEKDEVYAVLKSYPAGYILKPPDKDILFKRINDALQGNF